MWQTNRVFSREGSTKTLGVLKALDMTDTSHTWKIMFHLLCLLCSRSLMPSCLKNSAKASWLKCLSSWAPSTWPSSLRRGGPQSRTTRCLSERGFCKMKSCTVICQKHCKVNTHSNAYVLNSVRSQTMGVEYNFVTCATKWWGMWCS